MNIELISTKLFEVVSIIKNYEDEMDKDGSRFNIFSILNVGANEVRLHSNFIAELLNSKGSHGFGNKFCKQFISNLMVFEKNNIISDFNFENYIVEVEKSAGLISENYLIGGRIDIVITDNQKRRIIIENKIFAGDQQNQLLRYYNFDKQAILLYLTLNGDDPNVWSTNNELYNNKDFHCISYKYFISKWLEKCIEQSISKPKVSETISQYLHLIKTFTNQNQKNIMSEKLVNLIAENKELYNSIEEINNCYNIFRQRVNDKFWLQIRTKISNEKVITTETGIDIMLDILEDGDGFYYGFYLMKNGERIQGTEKCVMDLAMIFHEINPSFITNESYIGWTFSNVFKKFWWIDKEKIFDLNDEAEMNEFTNDIVNEVNQYIFEIRKRIK